MTTQNQAKIKVFQFKYTIKRDERGNGKFIIQNRVC